MCVNSSISNVIYKPTDEIYNFVRGLNFMIEFPDTLFDFNNYENPIAGDYSSFLFAYLNPNLILMPNIMPIEFTENKNVFY